MKPITREWVRKAEGDFKIALREVRTKSPVYDAICFHAQQCLKRWLP
jgi:HEPN domain-containing protein